MCLFFLYKSYIFLLLAVFLNLFGYVYLCRLIVLGWLWILGVGLLACCNILVSIGLILLGIAWILVVILSLGLVGIGNLRSWWLILRWMASRFFWIRFIRIRYYLLFLLLTRRLWGRISRFSWMMAGFLWYMTSWFFWSWFIMMGNSGLFLGMIVMGWFSFGNFIISYTFWCLWFIFYWGYWLSDWCLLCWWLIFLSLANRFLMFWVFLFILAGSIR